MSRAAFQGLVLRLQDGKTSASIEELDDRSLPDGDVLIEVEYSSLNYKDGLAVTGRGKIVQSFPMVPGIDLAGTVLEAAAGDYRPGDRIAATGWGLGERSWGGYAQRARVKSGWLIGLPPGLDTRRAMAIGTAGLAAMLCVLRLEEGGIAPDKGPIAVTGAGGGVGSVATAILAKLGYHVAAITGRPEIHDSLRALGASEIVDRRSMEEPSRPLEKQRWAGAVDTVGGPILARLLSETSYYGVVAACGLAGGTDLPATVMPFILRGVSLLGVESVLCPRPLRLAAWLRLAQDLPLDKLDRLTRVVSLREIPRLSEEILAGRVHGRVVVDLGH